MRIPSVRSCTDPGPLRYYERWPWAHLMLAICLAIVFSLQWEVILHNQRRLVFFWFGLGALLVHQFESHGSPGGFRRWFNSQIYRSENGSFPLSKRLSQMLNSAAVLLAAAAGWASVYEIWVGFAFLYTATLNALFRISASQLTRRYSPGTLTAGLLILPLSCYGTWRFVYTGEAAPLDLALGGAAALTLQGLTFLWLRRLAARNPELLQVASRRRRNR